MKEKFQKISLSLVIASLAVLTAAVFWQLKPKTPLSLYDFKQPERYNQEFLLSVSDYIFSMKPLDAKAAEMIEEGDIIKYLDAYQDTDIVQTKSYSRIKEEIILKKPGHPSEFKYQVNVEQYDWQISKNGDLVLYAKGKAGDKLSRIFTIPAPFLVDSSGQKTYDAVKMEIINDLLVITIDNNWLNNAVYPVTLDPTIEINILNIHSHPQKGDNWTVNFTTQGQANLKIIPNDQATIDDDEFVSLSCDGQNLQPQILVGDIIYYQNWQCSGTGQVIHYTQKAGKHALRFEFGDQIAYAYNSPGITIVQKAPDSGTPTTGGRVTSVSFDTLPSAGNLIVAVIIGTNEYGMDSEEGPQYVRDNQEAVNYTQAIVSTAGYSRAFIYYKDNIDEPSGTFTVTVTGYSAYTSWDMGLLEVSGYDPDNPLADVDYNTGTSATPSAGPVSVVGNALYVAATGREGTSGYTSATSTDGWTEQWRDLTGDPTMLAETYIGSGSQTATWIVSTSAGWHGVIAAFNENYDLDQEGFRFRNDDGSETEATWLADQDVDITQSPESIGTNVRLRIIVNAIETPVSNQYQLEYKKSTEETYKKVSGTTTPSVSFGAEGTENEGSTSLTPAYPSTITAGDMLVMGVINKYPTNGPATPDGWTKVAQVQGGAGAAGTDSGEVYATVFIKEAAGGETGTVSVSLPSANCSAAQIYRYDKAGIANTWSLATSTGSMNSTSTAWSIEGDQDPGFTTGDHVFIVSGINGDLAAWSSEAISSSGVTFSSVTEQEDNPVTAGDDCRLVTARASVTASTSFAVPTYTMTGSAGAAYHPAGATVILRLREVYTVPPISLSASSNIGAGGTASTTYQLDAPSGKTTSDFNDGKISDDTNPLPTLSIATNNYTELEWCLVATEEAAGGGIYQFRVTKNGTAFEYYTVTPQWIIAEPPPTYDEVILRPDVILKREVIFK